MRTQYEEQLKSNSAGSRVISLPGKANSEQARFKVCQHMIHVQDIEIATFAYALSITFHFRGIDTYTRESYQCSSDSYTYTL